MNICPRCKTPRVDGHGAVCILTSVGELSFYGGIILLLLFWVQLFRGFTDAATNDGNILGLLAALNAALLMLLSLVCSTRARWLRHEIVADIDACLDEDGSCCGGACAGSCGDGGCGAGGCSPEGCDDEDCCMKEEEGGGCGNGCGCAH